ncbi:hypothetical protein ACFX11_022985 [Malus domestica]
MLCKGMSSDNIKGLILVLSSSLFIGSSPPASLLLRREVEAVEERRVTEIEPFIIFHSSDEEFIAVKSTVRVFQKVCERSKCTNPTLWSTTEGERRILVVVDEGDESMYALSWCLKSVVAQKSEDTLILLYAKSPRAVFTSLDGTRYLISSETWVAMEKYAADVADCVMEIPRKANG